MRSLFARGLASLRRNNSFRRLPFVALAAGCIGACVWICILAHRVDKQRQAIDVILKLNGWYQYDFELSPPSRGDPLHPGSPSNADVPGPPVLTRFVGTDYVASVVYASIGSAPRAADLDRIAALDKLEYLMLMYRGAETSDLSWLEKLPNLKSVYIGQFDASDRAVDDLNVRLPSNLKKINRF